VVTDPVKVPQIPAVTSAAFSVKVTVSLAAEYPGTGVATAVTTSVAGVTAAPVAAVPFQLDRIELVARLPVSVLEVVLWMVPVQLWP